MPSERKRRHRTGIEGGGDLFAAFLLTPVVLESEQFHLICGAQQVDRRHIAAQIDPATLVAESDVQRVADLVGGLFEDSNELERRGRELAALGRQLGDTYEELSLLYKLSTSMLVNQAPAQFLAQTCTDLLQVVGLRWMVLQLVHDEPRLNDLAGKLFPAGPIGCDAVLLRRIGEQLMHRLPSESRPLIVDDTRTLDIEYLPRIARNLLAVPLVREQKAIGILFGADKLDDEEINSIDTKLCSSLAGSLSIFLENMMLYEDMQSMFIGTLHALSSAIDAKDSYTHGHSSRVALMSRTLAQNAGVDPRAVERVYLSGLVHDLGKIGVPEAVLCKTGPLSAEEFALIKEHPVIGARILKDIRPMADLIPSVLHHHERWDGKGYPNGLVGANIPLFARIICLADSFDAMCSTRTYRGSMQPEAVCAEIARCAGTQFDPELAEIFVKLDFSPFLDLLQFHHQCERQMSRSYSS